VDSLVFDARTYKIIGFALGLFLAYRCRHLEKRWAAVFLVPFIITFTISHLTAQWFKGLTSSITSNDMFWALVGIVGGEIISIALMVTIIGILAANLMREQGLLKQDEPSPRDRYFQERVQTKVEEAALKKLEKQLELGQGEPSKGDYSIPVEVRVSHEVIIGGSGSGKTTLILEDIANDLQSACSLVVFDSEGDIYERLLKVDHPRVVLIDPSDECPVSLSLFPSDVDRATELITFALDAINNPLTPPMKNMLRFVVRLCLQTENPTIHTLREVFTDFPKFERHIDQLPETAQAFFKTEFRAQKETRDRLTQRIFPLCDREDFVRVFSGRQTLNIKEKLDEGTLFLVRTPDEFFTRFFTYLVYQVIQERNPNDELMPVYLYLDEAKTVWDGTLVSMLERARKRRLGLVLAFQTLPQDNEQSLISNTAIKAVACGVSPRDARALADSVDSHPDSLTRKRPYTFYFHVAGLHWRERQTDKTALMKLPRRSNIQLLKEKNRELYCVPVPREAPEPIPSDDMESVNKA